MAIRKVTDCQGTVLWLEGRDLTVRCLYSGYNCTVAIRNVTDFEGPELWL